MEDFIATLILQGNRLHFGIKIPGFTKSKEVSIYFPRIL